MRADWLPINLSGRGWRFQRAACGAYAQMRGSARPDNALFQGKLASGWLINRRDNREARIFWRAGWKACGSRVCRIMPRMLRPSRG
jgi:hypothetical protein